MGKFSLENKIKDRLQGHEVHVDKRELWKALGIEEEEKGRKAIWLWWLGGVLGLAFIGGMWWYLQSDNLEGPIVQVTAIVEIDESIAKTGNETSSENTTAEQLAAIIDEVKSQSSEVKETTRQSPSASFLNQNRSNSTTNQVQENTLVTQRSLANESITSLDNSVNQANDEQLLNKGKNTETNGVVLDKELFIESLQIATSFLWLDRDLGDLSVDVKPLIKPMAKPRKIELEFFGGVGTINRTLSSENGDLENYLIGRDSSESTLEQLSLGISLKYIIGGGFYGKAGLTVNRWNEQYSYNLVSDTTLTPVEVPDVILIDLTGNSTIQYTEGFQTIYNSIDWVRYNRLTQIDLPITLGYEHRISQWSLFGEASVIFNLKQKFNGYLNTQNRIETKNPEIFKTSIGLNLGLNAGVGYGFTPRLRARLSARYYRSLGSVLLASTEIEQKYSSVGMRVGIGYLF